MRRARAPRLAALLSAGALALLLATSSAFAKAVRVKWKPLEGAIKYDLRLDRGSEMVLQKTLPRNVTVWQDLLPPGFYTYQLRGIDRFERPGEWSAKKLIAIKPDRPETLGPAGDMLVRLVNGKSRLVLKWTVKEAGDAFLLEYRYESDKVVTLRLPPVEREYEIADPMTGSFKWRIRSIIETKGAIPENVENKFGDVDGSDFTSWAHFKVKAEAQYLRDKGKFAAPVVAPIAPVFSPPRRGELKLQWALVDGAEGYEVIVEPEGARTPASPSPIRRLVRAPPVTIPVKANQSYRAKVRAISSLDPKSATTILGPETKLSFQTDTKLPARPGGRVVVGGRRAPYRADFIAPSAAENPFIESFGINAGVAADIWLGSRWGLAPAIDVQFVAVDGRSILLKSARLVGAYRLPLSPHPFGTDLVFHFGLGLQDYFGIIPPAAGDQGTPIDLTAIGPSLGIELRKVLSSRWDAALGVRLFVPLAPLKAPSNTSLAGDGRFSNFAAELRVGYRLLERWGIEASGVYERRDISWTDANGTGQTRYGGLRFGADLRYEWD